MSDRKHVSEIARNPPQRLKQHMDALLQRAAPYSFTLQVHEGYAYPPRVTRTKAWTNVGIFFDYLIRKELHYLLGRPAVDFRASYVARQFRNYEKETGYGGAGDCADDGDSFVEYDDSSVEYDDDDSSGDYDDDDSSGDDDDDESVDDDCERSDDAPPLRLDKFSYTLVRDLVASYWPYKDARNATIDVLEHVFNASSLHMLFFNDAASVRRYDPRLVNVANCETVLKHVATWNRTNVRSNPYAGCEYFRGDADVLLGDVLVDVKMSKYELEFDDDDYKTSCYQLILYALGLFVRHGLRIYKFKIYNPLLGIEYWFTIPNLKFEKLLTLVQKLEPL